MQPNLNQSSSNFYSFTAKTSSGETVSMERYAGKVVLVVNTASKCGLTSQYKDLQILHEKYHQEGLVILAFPCNQFGKQEPGSDSQIKDFCESKFGVTFELFAKVDVNGKNAHPIFSYLTTELPGYFGKKIKWNFTKFLVDKSGKPTLRFAPITSPQKIEKEIKHCLSKP